MNFQAHITKNHHLDMNKKETQPHIILSRGTYIQQKSANFKINMFIAFKKKRKEKRNRTSPKQLFTFKSWLFHLVLHLFGKGSQLLFTSLSP